MLPEPSALFTPAGLRNLWRRWRALLALTLALAALVSAFVARRLPNIYASTAVFLPTSPQSTDPDRLVEGAKLELGTRAEDLDRVVTIGASLPLAELIIHKFDLYHHYQMGEPGDDVVENSTLYEFTANLSIVHNQRDAIELTFQDRDKKLAAAVANALVAAIDSVNRQLTLTNRRQVLVLYAQRSAVLGRAYAQNRARMMALRRRYGILSQPGSGPNGADEQARSLTQALLATEKELHLAQAGGGGSVAGLRQALLGLTQGRAQGGNVVNLPDWVQGTDSVNLLTARLTDLQTRYASSLGAYEQAEVSLRSRVSSLYLVQQALPATRKSKPFRALIVLGSVALTGALALTLILLLEIIRQRKARQE